MTDWTSQSTQDQVEAIFERMHLCGCGNPDGAWGILWQMLERASNSSGFFYDALGEIPGNAVEFIAKVMDGWELLEHGTGIGSAWLTEDGELLLQFFRDHGIEEEKWPKWAQ